MNVLPCLQVDGKRVNSSLACCRFIARNVGLTGSDEWENLQIDTIADTVNDFRLSIRIFWKFQDFVLINEDQNCQKSPLCPMNPKMMWKPRKSEHWITKLFLSTWRNLKILQEITMDIWQMEKYEHYCDFFWANLSLKTPKSHRTHQLSWADFYFAGIIEYLNYLAKTDLVADFGNLRRVIDNVTCQDGVQEWINNRPKTEIWTN